MFSSRRGEARSPARLRRPRTWSLQTRLLLVLAGLLTLVCVGIGAGTLFAMNHCLTQQLDRQVSDAGSRSVVFYNIGPPPFMRFKGPGPMFLDAPGQSVGTVGAVVDDGHTAEAAVVALDGNRQELSPRAFQQLSEVARQSMVRIDLDGLGEYKLVGVGADDGRTVVAGLPMANVTDTLLSTLGFFTTVSIAALILAAAIGIVIIHRQFRPLSRVASAAHQVALLDLGRGEVSLPTPLVPVDPDSARTEVGQLGSAFNQMLERIADALAARHASETRVRQFVADASHELRTPLASIRGYAELARRRLSGRPDDLAHAIERVDAESKRMTQLVEDMLFLARMDAGRPLDRELVDLSQLAVDTVDDAHVAGPGHRWSVNVPDEPILILGDRLRLHQVLANLLSNARVHTPPGTRVNTTLRRAGDDHVVLTVTDDGPGIPAHHQPEIFERFARGDSSRSRRAGSTGLGLAIVQTLVKAHSGTIDVHSVAGQTVFAITLPAIGPTASRRCPSTPSSIAAVRRPPGGRPSPATG